MARTGDVLRDVAGLVAGAEDLEGLVRPLLEMLTTISDYEVAYLSVKDRRSGHQVWRFVHVAGGVGPPEGQTWPWTEVLCHWVAGRNRNSIADLSREIPGHPSNRYLGVRGFISVPYSLVGRDGEVAGTLCASSRQPVDPSPELLHVLMLFASIVADRFGREIDLGRERIRAEAAERTLVERTRFLAAAEHGLKTPLTIVRGWAERLTAYVEQLLSDANAALLGWDLHPAAIELAPYLPLLVAEFDGAAPSLALTCGAVDGAVHVDVRVLEQVLGHLLENAMKYAAGGGATVSAWTTPSTVVIAVDDDGPGLEPDLDPFHPFERGRHHARSTAGAGLGMHIVRRLVEASDGTVRATASPLGGARFEVELPRA